MANRKIRPDEYPPLDNRRAQANRFIRRVGFYALLFCGAAVLYWAAVLVPFAAPAEYNLKVAVRSLRSEYGKLERRLEQLEGVLANVEERDENVFKLLFESEPYDINSPFEIARWDILDELNGYSNRTLNQMMERKTDSLALRLKALENEIVTLVDTAQNLGSKLNYIPSIQPIINNELTLMTASYGERIQPFHKRMVMHTGVDYAVTEGTRVFATADGVVAEAATRSSSIGMTLKIDHKNGYTTRYNHLSRILVKAGQTVSRGDIIALTGNTGISIAPHLHYEIYFNGASVDPINYFFMELSPSDYRRLQNIAKSGMQSFE